MLKKTVYALLGLLLLFNAVRLFPRQSAEDAAFAKLVDKYLDSFWKFHPTAATLAGYYKYNDRLEELKESEVEKWAESLDGAKKDIVSKIHQDRLSPDNQIDREMIIDAMDLEQLRLENLAPHQYNPIFYNDIILNSIRSLLVKEFAPVEARLRSAVERARQLPRLLKLAKDNLKTPPREYTEAALRQFPAILEFYRNQAMALAEAAPAALKTSFQNELTKVVPALEDYQKYMQGELLNKSTGNFRLGPDVHTRLLRLTCQSRNFMNEFITRANADSKNILRDMFLVCIPFYKIMRPKFDIEHPPANMSEDQIYHAVIAHVMNTLPGDSGTAEDIVSRVKADKGEIETFLSRTKFLAIPEADFTVEAMPAASQGPLFARLLFPSPYGRDTGFSCQIAPVPREEITEQVQSRRDEYNSYYLKWLTIQKVYPGEFFPAYFAMKNATLVRKLYPNQPLLKGWPLFIEDAFIDQGFGGYDLRLRLSQLKSKLKAVIDFQLELNIHQGGLTKDQAIRLMTITGFQTRAEAERKWQMIALNPGEAAYAYVGSQEILDMEKEFRKIKGEAFNESEFLQKILSYGALPLRSLRTKILQ